MDQTHQGSPVRVARAAFVAIVALVLAACGTAATPTPAGPTTVAVGLQEWAIVPASTTIKAGEVTFDAKNDGPDDAHELVVIRTDLGLLDLPTGADGKVDEAGAGMTMIGEIEEFAVGESASGTFDLAAGRYLLICNIVDADGDAHYGKGMTIAITVE
jgi:uncharacterized cupredoxin-like copper-binding protein